MSDTTEHLYRGYTGHILILLSVGLAFARLGRRALSPLLPTIITDLSISPFQAGIALSLASVAFALLQYPSGRLSDQLNRKTVLLSSLSILVLGSILLSLSTTYVLLLIACAIIGIGEGLYGAADRGMLSDLFVTKRGIAFGIHTTFSDIGGILAAVFAAAALALGPWRVVFLPAIAGLICLSIILFWVGREPINIQPVSFGMRQTVGRLFGNYRFFLLLLAYSLFNLTSQGFVGFLPTLLQADKSFSPGLASLGFALMFATGILARPIAGRMSDLENRLLIAGSGLLTGAIGIIVLVLATGPLVASIGIIIFAAGIKAFPPTMQAYLMDSFPDSSMAGDLGATRTVYIGIGSLGPAYVGYVGENLSYTTAFTGFVAALLIGGALILWLMATGSG